MTSTIEHSTTADTDRCTHPVGVIPTINRTPVAPGRFAYVTPHDLFGALTGGGSISVEEYPRGEITEAAKAAEKRADSEDGCGSLVIALTADSVGGAPINTVWFHPDQDDRLEVIRRARAALDDAEAALEEVGYVDKAFLAVADAERSARAEHDAGRCQDSEWSCSYCEAG